VGDDRGMLWGGRFSGEPHPDMLRVTRSIDVDLRLLPYDAEATKAHARALEAAGLLGTGEVEQLDTALDALIKEWRAGEIGPDPGDEDVHSLVERILTERLGDTGARIHAGRSRNDLVATDLRLYCKDAAAELARRAGAVVAALARLAETHAATLMPGYTHLQRGQSVSLGFHLAAHGFALARDARRFSWARSASDCSALGAGALAGTTLPIDPEVPARRLGFGRVFDNAMDATSERDFVCDLLYACSLCGVHMARLAEEIVLWSSAEFGFVHLPDEWSTGSSMMPQKRNPDVAELIRGRSAEGIGALAGMLALLKGLPLAYNRDLQEDKQTLFAAVDRTAACLEATAHLLPALGFDEGRMAAAAAGTATWATDVAEVLVARGVPFRVAHAATGTLVRRLEEEGVGLSDAEPALLTECHELLEEDDRALADPGISVRARAARGGTAPERVTEQVRALLRSAAGEFLPERPE
jgi:argininosuccinate lyase